MTCGSIDCSEECGYNYLKKRIVDVLRKKCFEVDDAGSANPEEFDANFSAQEAIDEICDIVGGSTASGKSSSPSPAPSPKTKRNVKLLVADIDWDLADENGGTFNDAVGIANSLPDKVELTISESDWLDKDHLDKIAADRLCEKHDWFADSCYYNKIVRECDRSR